MAPLHLTEIIQIMHVYHTHCPLYYIRQLTIISMHWVNRYTYSKVVINVLLCVFVLCVYSLSAQFKVYIRLR